MVLLVIFVGESWDVFQARSVIRPGKAGRAQRFRDRCYRHGVRRWDRRLLRLFRSEGKGEKT
jgi:hypothetical protein